MFHFPERIWNTQSSYAVFPAMRVLIEDTSEIIVTRMVDGFVDESEKPSDSRETRA